MPKLSNDSEGLTGSRVAAALGQSKWATSNDTLEESYRAVMGWITGTPATHVMDFGNAVEAWTIERAFDGLPVVIQRPGPLLKVDHLQCSVDALALIFDGDALSVDPSPVRHTQDGAVFLAEGEGVIEAKFTSKAEVYSSTPPFWHGPAQVYAAMACSDATWGAVAINFAGRETHTWFLARDEAIIEEINATAIDFKERLGELVASSGQRGWYPLASSSDGETVFPHAEEIDEPVELNGDQAHIFVDLMAGKKMIETGKEVVDQCEAQLKEVLQSRPRGRVLLEDPITTAKDPEGSSEWIISWPMRNYQATPERVTPAKPARSVRQSTLTVRPIK